jgi:murein DD-endopeptidase MepM/ murein hydrolase activator NlpD
MKNDSQYRVLVVPQGEDAPVRQFAVSRHKLGKLGALGVAVVALLVLLPALVVGLSGQQRAAELEAERQRLAHRLEGLERRVEGAESDLARVQAYDAKVRRLTAVDEGVRPFGIGPLGDLEIQALQGEVAGVTLSDAAARRVSETAEAEPAEDLELRVDSLADALDAEEVSQQELRSYLENREALLRAYPTAWPADGWITSHYGFRISPLPGAKTFHTGTDIAAAYGTPIFATADGVVISAGHREAYGYTVEIDHGFGIVTLYAHCSRLLAAEGDLVQRGEIIARMGATGRATGPHLHYEVQRDGVQVNPEDYLLLGETLGPIEVEE